MNPQNELGGRIRREAARIEAGWPFRMAELNARKAGHEKVAATCRNLAYLEEQDAGQGFDLGFVVPRTTTADVIPGGDHVYFAMEAIKSALNGSNPRELIKEEGWTINKGSQIDDIFVLAGIDQEMRDRAIPTGATPSGEHQIFKYESNLGVTLTEYRGRNRHGVGIVLFAEKTPTPQQAAA